MNYIKVKGFGTLSCFDSNGNLKWKSDFTNTVTNVGKAQIALLIGDGTATPFTFLALGTDTTPPSVSQTALGAEIADSGLQRATATVSRTDTTVTNDTVVFYHEFTASGSKTVQEVGIFNASSLGIMLGRALIGARILTSGDKLQVTYNVSFS